jgi:signal transduction histidine kinase
MSSARASSASLQGRALLEPALRQAAGRLRDLRPDLDVSVQVGTGVQVGVESALLERLLAPVVENAGRYAGARVELAATRCGPHARVVISDDGPGVSPDEREHVFAAGYRADPGDGHPGAGLGLPLARRLAEAAGGRVQVVGDPPGARFVIELPLA